jgi:SAM-dependent methyltransferase
MPVVQGAFESAAHDRSFDVVCAFHVLEHVEDPSAFLRAGRDALAPGGRIAIEVPNIASAAAGRLGTSWPHIQPQYHRWHFSPDSLRRVLVAGGFEIVSMDTVFSRFYWQPLGRLRHARDLLVADWVASGSPRVAHPDKGDVLRVIARRVESGSANPSVSKL